LLVWKINISHQVSINMIAHNSSQWFKAALCRPVNIVSIALALSGFAMTGCGGGGANSGVTPVAPTSNYSDSRASLPDAVSRSFVPNYAPSIESDGVWKGRTLRVFYTNDSEEVVSEALRRWESATGGFFQWARVSSESDAQVVFSAKPEADFASGTVGRTQYTYNAGRKELISAEVKYSLVGMHSDQTRVVVHEIGHVLGIHGHSEQEQDVMYPTLTLRNVITERDLNTVFWLYRGTAAEAGTASRSVGQEVTATVSCGGL
jgi:hypothetical protein